MNNNIRNKLVRHDEKGVYEFPSEFDYENLEKLALLVNEELRMNGFKTTYEGAVFHQDASFSIAIILDDFKIDEKNVVIQPTIRFSNFGKMTSITFLELIPGNAISSIIAVLTKHEFCYIPYDQLDVPYDGIMEDKKTFYSWWIRYFDWI